MAIPYLFANNASATLASGVVPGDTTITLSSGQGSLFPTITGNKFFLVTLVDASTKSVYEIVKVTSVNGDVFTVVRGQEGTVPNNYSIGDIVSLQLTAGICNSFLASTQVNMVVFRNTGNYTYTPTVGTVQIMIEAVAGGGQGGGTYRNLNSLVVSGGGGAGGYVRAILSNPPSSIPVTVGAGGTGALPGAYGNPGGSTVFGSYFTCNGGAGGGSGGLDPTSIGGPGGSIVTGSSSLDEIVGIVGGSGTGGIPLYSGGGAVSVTCSTGGQGGDSYLGYGGVRRNPVEFGISSGVPGTRGAGGSGMSVLRPGTDLPNSYGIGGPGIIIIYEYI